MSYKKLSKIQQKYFAMSLGLKKPKWETDAMNDALIAAKVDPIPHQVEAAKFVFRNPFSGGVILGDEVGLGKTIETGLVLSQLWAEGKRKILIIAPKSLRHQWEDELRELFFLESEIIDTRFYAKVEKGKAADPLEEDERILITNEHFVVKYEERVKKAKWDVVVIDEAHKLRNVWKAGKNEAKRAKAVRDAIEPFKKLLLTATPMQNNLMELYGLCTFLDPHALGSAESFKRNFVNCGPEELKEKLEVLKYRMSKFFKRELRRNVQAFIPYTDRNAVTIPFDPTNQEEELRITFENYLRDPNTVALPPIANGFLRLVYYKLLASSSFALKNSLNNLYVRLVHNCVFIDDEELFNELINKITQTLLADNGEENEELIRFKKTLYKNVYPQSFQGLKDHLTEAHDFEDVLKDEGAEENYDEQDLDEANESEPDSTTKERIQAESEVILRLIVLCRDLSENTKGNALVAALDQQLKRAKENNWPEKAVIFTEFKTTQNYVIKVLTEYGMDPVKDIVIFNGDSGSTEERRQLVEEFRGEKKIFLTTEAGAEGLNLQFCNLLINYDLPWNPQRIEQRIGRCHRYGQKLDVVVVNFANKKNMADIRILELLNEKFKLFEGAFGVSNTVLGQIESGTDVEKEILNIYLTCRNEEEIVERFETLFQETEEMREEKFRQAKEIILTELDEEVQSKLKSIDQDIKTAISEKQKLVRDIVLSHMENKFTYDQDSHTVVFLKSLDGIENGTKYTFSRNGEARLIPPNSKVVSNISSMQAQSGKITLQYTGNHNISMIENLVGSSGSFKLYLVKFSGIEQKEILYPVVRIKSGEFLSREAAEKLFTVTSVGEEVITFNDHEQDYRSHLDFFIKSDKALLEEYNDQLYDEEVEKMDDYYDDLKELCKRQIEDIEKQITKLKKERRKLKTSESGKINKEITRLKGQVATKQEKIAQLHRENVDKEKVVLDKLNNQVKITVEITEITSGEFEVI